ncbi:hypothetical protein CLOM_g23362, partial [Closterium sp. NIES-68]
LEPTAHSLSSVRYILQSSDPPDPTLWHRHCVSSTPSAILDSPNVHDSTPCPLLSYPFAPNRVADGVGGWADVGVDAGAYARELMGEAEAAVRREPKGCADTLRVLTSAHAKTRSEGSCTACLVVLTADRLQAANLGDSGFVVVRNGRIIFKSPPQQHDFNFPFQLGSDGGDSPSAAEVFSLPVAAGDVVVVGTDGLFDNVFDSELASTVMHSLLAGREPQHTAEHIATLARTRAQDRIRISPFARAAQEAGYRYYGGKLDDITVVVAYVAGPKFGPGWWRNCR